MYRYSTPAVLNSSVSETPSVTAFKHQLRTCLFDSASASLRLVSPGVTTDGVTPIFSRKKLTTFFSQRHLQSDNLFWLSDLSTSLSIVQPQFFIHSRVTPVEGVTREVRPTPPSDATVLLITTTWMRASLAPAKLGTTEIQMILLLFLMLFEMF